MKHPTRAACTLVLASMLGLAGCASFTPQPGPGIDPPSRFVDLTRPIVAVGDTQEHESTGYPLHENDSAIDAYVEVAQRPPEQPLFGRRILEWALTSHPDEPYLHLGDVMGLSCRSESDRILSVMRKAGRQGAILPGNHDGLMFGIYGYNIFSAVLDDGARQWNQACRRGAAQGDDRRKSAREAMSKREFIAVYLAEQARRTQDAAGLPVPVGEGQQRLSWRNPDRKSFLSAVEANLLEGYRYADSFVAQRLRMPPAPGATREVLIIGLDTNQAGALVTAWDTVRGRSPGSMGHVKFDQVAAVTPWIDEAIRDKAIVVFAGHHNWSSLGLPTRLQLRSLMSRLDQPLVYLSAHTHRGFWALHTALDRRPLLELNVSALSDWPIAYRRISFAYDEAAQRLLVRGDLMPGGRPVGNDADLLAAWHEQACTRIGPQPDALIRFDRDLVKRQRESRGNIVEWVLAGLSASCERCENSMHLHANAYQDAMLDAILQLANHLGPDAHRLHNVKLPQWCGASDFEDCARSLKAQSRVDTSGHRELFRRKATLVDLLSTHLDELDTPQAAAYMTCRAVHAAKIDFDLTDDSRNGNRGEAKRRAEQFFRVEASVGMR